MQDRLKQLEELLGAFSPEQTSDAPMMLEPEMRKGATLEDFEVPDAPEVSDVQKMELPTVEQREAVELTPESSFMSKGEPASVDDESGYPELSKSFYDNITKFEGFRNQPYDDKTGKTLTPEDIRKGNYRGKPTIGYGRVLTDEELKTGKLSEGISLYGELTPEQAQEMIKKSPVMGDIADVIVANDVDLTEDQRNALYSFGYNLGPARVDQILKIHKAQGPEAAAQKMKEFTYAGKEQLPGLVNRRKAESNVYLNSAQPKQPSRGIASAPSTQIQAESPDITTPGAPLARRSTESTEETKDPRIKRLQELMSRQKKQLGDAKTQDLISGALKVLDKYGELASAANPNFQVKPVSSGLDFKTNRLEELQKLLDARNKPVKVGNSIVQYNPETQKYEPLYKGKEAAGNRLLTTINLPDKEGNLVPTRVTINPNAEDPMSDIRIVGTKAYALSQALDAEGNPILIDRAKGQAKQLKVPELTGVRAGAKVYRDDEGKGVIDRDFQLSKVRQERLDKISDDYNKYIDKVRTEVGQLRNFNTLTLENPEGALGIIRNLAARVLGKEVGALTEGDLKRVYGTGKLTEKFKQFIQTQKEDKMTPQIQQNFLNMLDVALGSFQSDFEKKRKDALGQIKGIPTENTYLSDEYVTQKFPDFASEIKKIRSEADKTSIYTPQQEARINADMKEQSSEVERKTKDGRIAVFNKKTKQFLRYK